MDQNPNIAFYILTYNRPNILKVCLETLFTNTNIKYNEAWLIDDGSQPDLKHGLLDFSIANSTAFPINTLIHGRNYGIGFGFERIYNLMRQNDDLDIGCIIESDYVWRKNWLEDVVAVFEASPLTVAIAGVSHPDMVDKNKTHGTFPEIMKECFGEDLTAREHLYKPFDLNTSVGSVKVQGVSNSCGCLMINWKRFKEVITTVDYHYKFNYWKRMDRAFNKGIAHDTRANASDGHMSSNITYYGEKYILMQGEDISKHFPMLDICDYSISQHICGGGVNSGRMSEGNTFILSPNWKDEYIQVNPRKI